MTSREESILNFVYEKERGTWNLPNHQVRPSTALLKDQLKLSTSTLELPTPIFFFCFLSDLKKIIKRLSLSFFLSNLYINLI